jgi:hypothetical protein
MAENEITWIGEKKNSDPIFANQIFELPSDDTSLIAFSVGIALGGKHTILDLPSIYSLPEVIHHLNACDFSNTHPVHSKKYRDMTDEMECTSSEFPLSLVVRIPITNADNIEPILEQYAVSSKKSLEIWMSSDELLISQLSRQKRRSPLIILQQPSNSKTIGAFDEPPVGVLVHHSQKKPVVSIFVTASSWSLCEDILKDIGDDILDETGWNGDTCDFELILIHRIQPLPLSFIKERLDNTGRGIFVDIPSSSYQSCIQGSFWRLEAEPQQMFLGHLSYQKAKHTFYRALYLLLEQ